MNLQKRIITIVSTKGDRIEKVETNVSTWGELKSLIQDNYDLSNLKAVENINKSTLESNDAILPEGDFRLFLRASKTKSGIDTSSMSFKELRASLTDDSKSYLSKVAAKSGKNWTQLTTVELREHLSKFHKQSSKKSVSSTEKTRTTKSSKESEEIKRELEEIKRELEEINRGF